MNPGDALLGWLYAEGSGTVDILRQRVTWYGSGRPADETITPRFADFQWIREMSALAYLEVDFGLNRWTAAPPALVVLPGLDGLCALTGVREAALAQAVDDLGDDGFAFYHSPASNLPIPLPDMLFIQLERQSAIDRLHHRLRVHSPELVNARCAASAIASIAQPIRTTLRLTAAPVPDPGSELERLDIENLLTDMSDEPLEWIAVSPHSPTVGAYRWRRQGRLLHAAFSGEAWQSGERSDVIHTVLSRMGESSLTWMPSDDSPLQRGILSVNKHLDLPALHKRAATLCTGLPSRVLLAQRTYQGVPLYVARLLATSLGQHLERDGTT